MSTADKLQTIINTKAAIRQAILDKGVVIADSDTFASYPNKIANIESDGSSFNIPDGTKFGNSTWATIPNEVITYVENLSNLDKIFNDCSNITGNITLDLSKATKMQNFMSAKKLGTVRLKTPNVTSINYLFSDINPNFKLYLDLDSILDGYYAGSNSSNGNYDVDYFLNNLGKANVKSYSGLLSMASWSYDSLIYTLLDHSVDRTTHPKGNLSIALYATTKAKLTDSDIAAITAKGYTIT
ncbi:hypothetical protein [Parabacteroides gordonii]|uniref:Uncharacterized protein n=1 Tax=Parabacteroides gordonii MS-1 = DSM 23371 TaxID=1203610 RepID=A0A0F5JCH6_9BACT|nr:hypothetical protein [Parabacteroides gordonii]KKB55546.1 hypothetical protein HMPREF1536_03017 [Parabacteroides gordonii MS-1 = DSM 23371]MCA5581667.1 hypothetical protein [Parabacteroides gordonii]